MINFTIELTEIFPGSTRIIIADSILNGLKYWSKKIGDPLTEWINHETYQISKGGTYQTSIDGRVYFSIIITKDGPLTTLIHESLHLTFYILSHYDIYFNPENHEILCRTQQALLNKILPELKKRKIELK